MQMNLTLSFFGEDDVLDMAERKKTLYEAVIGKEDLGSFIVPTAYKGVDVVPATSFLYQIEFQLFSMMQREFVLKKCLSAVKAAGTYDYILIDSPPTLGNWVINILCASDHVIMPVEASS